MRRNLLVIAGRSLAAFTQRSLSYLPSIEGVASHLHDAQQNKSVSPVSRRTAFAALTLLCMSVLPSGIAAQAVRNDSTAVVRAWLTKQDAVVGGFAIAATLAFAPFDSRAARELQEQQLQRSNDLQHAARELAFVGGPGPFIAGAGLIIGGRLSEMPSVARAGLHLTEAVLISASLTGLAKGLFGRALPQTNVNNSDDFQLFRGFHDGNGPFVSFPSGHAAASFAMAAVVTGEVGRSHPAMARFIAPFAYGTAGLVGVARMYQNVHWASDLPLAAAIGTWSGLTVLARSYPSARHAPLSSNGVETVLSALLESTTLSPATRGEMVSWWVPLDIGRHRPAQ